jgi:PadR family transcriptional regulator, regulatory protein PadR
MNIENAKAQMRKGLLEYAILTVISKGETYANDIIEALKLSKLIVVEGTLYPLLTRLKNSGLLSYSWVESTSGPPRKYYKLTPEGEAFLGQMHLAWADLVESINTTISLAKKSNNE